MLINGGNAGHIHHGCMASAIHLSSAVSPDGYLLWQPCCEPPVHVLSRLNDLALIDLGDEAQDSPMWVIQELLPPSLDSRETRREYHHVVAHLCQVQKLAKANTEQSFLLTSTSKSFWQHQLWSQCPWCTCHNNRWSLALMQGWHFAELGWGSLRWPHSYQTLQIWDDYPEEVS
jgi:hypothetical protein